MGCTNPEPTSGLPKRARSCSPDAQAMERPFDDPIPLPRGRQIVTLIDAASYIMKLPKAEQKLEEWQTATEC
jgi:hypothetical protein